MPFNFTPQSSMPLSHGDGGVHGKATELAGGQVAAQMETQLGSPAEISQAHQFFAKSAESAACAAAPAFSAPPLDVASQAHAAGQAVSPLIQLIMRMPGHMAAVGSLFEVIGNFFAPAQAFSLHGLLPGNIHDAALSLSLPEHMPIDPSILPHNAPILHDMHGVMANGLSTMDAASLHIPNIAHTSFIHSPEQLSHSLSNNPQNVSGVLDAKKPQFEIADSAHKTASNLQTESAQAGQDGLLSGPDISSANLEPAISGNHRFFADKLDSVGEIGKGSHFSAHGQTQNLQANSQPTGLNVGGSPFGEQAMSLHAGGPIGDQLTSGPSLSQNLSSHLAGQGQPIMDGTTNFGAQASGGLQAKPELFHHGVLDLAKAGADKSLSPSLNAGYNALAESTAQAAPTSMADISHAQALTSAPQTSSLGTATATTSLSTPSQPASHTLQSASLTGMKAQALSLADVNKNVFKPAFDSIGHQIKAHPAAANHAGGHVMDQIAHGHHGRHVGQFESSPGIDQISHQIKHHVQSHVASQISAQPKLHIPDIQRSVSSQVDGIGQANPMAQVNAQASASPAIDSASGNYTVVHGDSLWKIAQNKLGSGARWHEIYELNAKGLGTNPSLIHSGLKLELPGQATDVAGSAASASKYVVQSGDNLWKIASQHAGGGQNWSQIYQANANVIGGNPRLILPGQELSLPSGSEVAQAAQPIDAQAMAQPSASAPVQAQAAYGAPGPGPISEAIPAQQSAQSMFASGATQAAQAQAISANAQKAMPGLVPSSLRPDLSFLSKHR